MRAAVASLAAAAALVLAWPSVAADAGIAPLPLSIAVAAVDDPDAGVHPAADDAWVDAQIAEATRLFSAHGVQFEKRGSRPIDARYGKLETRADRDALARELRPGVINVFVVSSLRDVDDPARYRMGVCWSPRGDQRTRFVVVSSIARPSVLAHELGHYHGLSHSRVRNNVMSYDRDGGEVFFDPLQAKTIRASAQRYWSEGIVLPR